MEISWKWVNLCLGLLFFQLCNGFPINLEESAADKHTQFLTGLVAVLLTVCSVVFLAGCLCCQRRNGFKEFRDSPVIASSTSNLDNGHVNPVANGEFTIFTPLSPPHYNNNVFLANERIITRTSEDYVNGDFDVSSWFNESEKDFPRIKLKYIKELGKGWFGKVVEGAAKDLQNEQTWTPVVVRILEATASRKERVVFLNDAAIYRCGTHPNILFLIGRCLDTVPLLLLQEYCPQGDLKTYLRGNKENADKLLSTDHPLLWCCQLSSALKHLHDNKVTHPDLATRNCQLTSNLTLKLGDYGLAVFKYPEDYYQGSPGVPVRWCSPESLNCTLTTIQPKKTTPESNIWSFSVTIWEILECGEQPYPDLSDDEVVSQVLGSNIRLTRPSFPFLYTDYMYRLMQLCWTSAESRPTVTQINLILTDLLQVHKNTKNNMLSVNDFDKRWELFKPNAIVKSDSISDAVNFESEEVEVKSTKPLSPSLNNLHGSLDDLLLHSSDVRMNSWSENASETDDFVYAKNESNEIQESDDPLTRENSSSDSSSRASPKLREPRIKSKINFDLTSKYYDNNSRYNFSDSVLFSQRTSSESETEDENWRNKVERGAYTEKVRLKSRSVADLMILTHVDYSESESETPLPSLDYRINYKNVRYAPKNNLENVSLTYGSEGNLLNVHDTFQHDLKKMQEERRDSLLFVPDNRSQSSVLKLDNNTDNLFMTNLVLSDSNISNMHLVDTPSKRLMHELNSTADMKPANQVFNVFNVTIDKFKPIKVNNCKLNEIINFNDDISHSFSSEKLEPKEKKPCERSKEITSDSAETLHLNNQNYAQKSNNYITNLKHISDSSKNTYPAAESIEIYPDTVVLNEVSDNEKLYVIKSETTSEISREGNSETCKELDNFNQHLNESKSLDIHKTDLEHISQHVEPNMCPAQVLSLSEIIQNKLVVSDDEKLGNSCESDVIESGTTSKISEVGNSEMCKQLDDFNQHLNKGESLHIQSTDLDNISQHAEPNTCPSQVPSLSGSIQNKLVVSDDEKLSNSSESDVTKSGTTSKTSEEGNSEMCKQLDDFNQHLNKGESLHIQRTDLDNITQHVELNTCPSQVPSLSEIIQNKLVVSDDEKLGNSSESDVIKSGTTSEISVEGNSEMCKKLDDFNQHLNKGEPLHIQSTDLDNISQHAEPNTCPSQVPSLSEIIQNKLVVSDDEKLSNSSESDIIKSGTTSKTSEEGNSEFCKQLDDFNQHLNKGESLHIQSTDLDNISQHVEPYMCPSQVPSLSEIIQNKLVVTDDEKLGNSCESDVIKSGTTSKISEEGNSEMCKQLDDFNQHLNKGESLHIQSTDLDDISQHMKPNTCPSQVPSLSGSIQNKLVVSDDEKLSNSSESDVTKSGTTSKTSEEGNSEMCKQLDDFNQHLNKGESLHIQSTDLDNISQHAEPNTCPSQVPSLAEIIQNKLVVSDDEKLGNSSESDVIKSGTTSKTSEKGSSDMCKQLDDFNQHQHLNRGESLHIQRTNLDNISQHVEPYMCPSQVPSLSEIIQNKLVVTDDEKLGNSSESDVIKSGTTSEILKEDSSEICKDLDNCNQQLNESKSLHIHRTDLDNISQHVEPKMCLSQVPPLPEIIQNNKLLYPIINPQNEDEDKVILYSTNEKENKIKDTEEHESHSSFDITNRESPFESEKHVEGYENCDVISNCEIAGTDKLPDGLNISFDLSNNQEKIMPNSLTHYGGFSSTPFKKKIDRSLPSEDVYSSLNLFNAAKDDEIDEEKDFFSNFTTTVENTCDMNNKELNYSLETWDNFLGKTLDNQNEIQNENLFDSFSSEPHSLLFVQNPDEEINQNKPEVNDNTFDVMDKTFIIEDECNKTFIVDADNENEFLNKSNTSHSDDGIDNCSWESGEGWFLHPQSNEELSGVIEVTSANTDSYVGFGIDDEIMAAIRNELLTKLPQAQVATSEKVQEAEDWDSSERDEVFLKYNVYNPPLSPILEESYIEDSSGVVTPKHESENDDSEWSQPCIPETLLPDTESHSAQTCESPLKEPHHRHTPSQDSCCSNDTLFNLEELTCATTDFEKDIALLKNTEESDEKITNEKVNLDATNDTICTNEKEINKKTETNNNNDEKNLNVMLEPLVPYQLHDQVDICEQQHDIIDYDQSNLENDVNQLSNINIPEHKNFDNTPYINNFLTLERDHTSKNIILIDPHSKSNSSSEETPVAFTKCQVAPLPSPEDNPWKQLPASMLSYDKVKSQSKTSLLPPIESKHIPEYNEHSVHVEHENKFNEAEQSIFDDKEPNYVNCDVKDIIPVYENVDKASDFYNEADYVNIENLENTRNNAEQVSPTENEKHNYVNSLDQSKSDIIKNEMDNDDDSCIFGMLTNIKFNGPIDNQLISTSFSESNDLNDEQDWDSGSDTRSSSSGEFIWKEGEHEESLKALRAAPQDTESINPSAGNAEESSDESDISSSTSGEEEETPEFIPSAWDKFATPTKSALRSPEKTLEKSDMKKTKGVWFKKQKYHCIYEYPREPESPVLQSDDLWKLQNSQIDYNSFTDWEFDADNYLPPQMDESDISPPIYQPKHISSKNLYQLTNITDLVSSNTGEEDEFFVNNSTGLLDIIGSLSSQFFPGSTNWVMENATPDSGVEDITPGSLTDSNEFSNIKIPDSNSVQTLKKLAAEAVNKNRQINIRNNDVLGGLRHTRNMLTLDLPLSPSAFTSAKTFMVEPTLESVVREKPTFTTFGKSRFSVQHVDTPSDEIKSKNVSFEALPYTPLKDSKKKNNSHVELRQNTNQNQEISEESHILKHDFNTESSKGKFELVKGEASLLDSADEDSGIESSTLERKLTYDVLS